MFYITDFMISKIFGSSGEYNIYKYIEDILPQYKKNHETLIAPLRLIDHLFSKYPRHMKPYYNITLEKCQNYSRSDIDSWCKDSALGIMCNVLEKGYDLNIQFNEIKTVYNNYFQFLKTSDKKTSGVILKNVFILLGIIAKNSPEVIENENELIKHYLRTLENIQIDARGASLKIYGAFKGLMNILIHFDHALHEDEQKCKKIYNIVKKSCEPKWLDFLETGEKGKVFECRSSLEFISEHPVILKYCMTLNDIDWWGNTLKRWFNSKNIDNKKVGLRATLQFYWALDEVFRNNTGNDSYTSKLQVI